MTITTIKRYGALIDISQIENTSGAYIIPSYLFSARADHCIINTNTVARTLSISFQDGATYAIDISDNVAAKLVIDGVNFGADTMDNIKIALGALFLSATGGSGGGGTTDNTTTPFLPYKSGTPSFENSSIKQTTAPAGIAFKLDVGKNETSIQLEQDAMATVKQIIIGNAQPVVSPYNIMKMVFDFIANTFSLISNTIFVGDIFTSSAVAKFDKANGKIDIGDVGATGNGTLISLDDANKYISIGNQANADAAISLDSVNDNIVLACTGQAKVFIDNVAFVTEIGDIGVFRAGTKITVDEVIDKILKIIPASELRNLQ